MWQREYPYPTGLVRKIRKYRVRTPAPGGRSPRHAREREVADRVEHLVAHELVGKARAFRVEDAVVADDQGVLERGSERIARIPQGRDVAHEAEGARAGDLAAERLWLYVDRQGLAADERVVELHLGLDPEAARVGTDFAEGIAHGDTYRLEHLDMAPRLIERLETDQVNRGHERRRAAVHDRRFWTVDF